MTEQILDRSERVKDGIKRLEGRTKDIEKRIEYNKTLIALLGTPTQDLAFLLGIVSVDRLLQMGLGIRKVIDGFDPDIAYSESEWTSRYSGLRIAQIYLENAAHAVGGDRFRRIFTPQSGAVLNGDEKNYRYAALYNIDSFSPIGTTLADVKPNDKRRFKESLMRAVDTAYSMLQSHQLQRSYAKQ